VNKIKYVMIIVMFMFGYQTASIAAKSVVTSHFSEKEKEAIEGIVHDYLINTPEVLVDASRALQQKQQKEMLSRANAAIPENATKLFAAQSPVIGNKKGDVYFVEFFDYQCGHCKRLFNVVEDLIKEDKGLRVIAKEFPIFGEVSEYASKMALAANKQGKYYEFHSLLMTTKGPLTKDKIKKLASTPSLKLDVQRLERDMGLKDINEELKKTMELAKELGLMGTPAMVIASNVNSKKMKSFFIPGSSTKKMLQSMIKQAREAK